MKSKAIFVNAVMDVRIEQGVFHFCLGEMAPTGSGQAEFIPTFRGILPASEAFGLFGYLKDKADFATANEAGPALGPSTSRLEQSSSPDEFAPKAVQRRRIAVSDGESHLE